MPCSDTFQQLHNQRSTYIEQYNPDWKTQFETEATQLKSLLNIKALDIEHIGSTAIPGMNAKPVIDILITVNNIQDIDTFNHTLALYGYIAGGEFGIVGRRFFCKSDLKECYTHLHVYNKNHPSVPTYRLFRDYMISHPTDAQKYASLKAILARKYSNDRRLYTQHKNSFIQEVLAKAAVL